MTGHFNFVFTFQLTPSRRATDTPARAANLFLTHALTEGDLYFFRDQLNPSVYFNFMPLTEGDEDQRRSRERRKISTLRPHGRASSYQS